jgi:hypothetical protein
MAKDPLYMVKNFIGIESFTASVQEKGFPRATRREFQELGAARRTAYMAVATLPERS